MHRRVAMIGAPGPAAAAIARAMNRRAAGMSGTTPMGVQEDAPNSPQNVQPVDLPLRNFPPMNWENLDVLGYVALPAIGSEATVAQFTVPIGRNGIVRKIANNYIGGGWVEGSGDVIWKILVDGGAPPPGATSYNSILGSLGNPASPTEIAGFRVFENQVISIAIKNVAVVVAGQKIGGRLVGYFYPRELESAEVWI